MGRRGCPTLATGESIVWLFKVGSTLYGVYVGDPSSGGGDAGWCDVSTASYDSVSFDVSSQDSFPTGIAFKPDGTKMYMGGVGSNTVYQYTLSTAWDVDTVSYDDVSFDVSSQGGPRAIAFKPDGTKMYMVRAGWNKVHQYSLSTAWDLDTASYDSVSFSVTGQDNAPWDIAFKPDGTKMYVIGVLSDKVHQYSLSTAWDLSTASYDSVSFSATSQDIAPWGIAFKPDGTKIYVVGGDSDTVYQYSLSTTWDVATASYDSVSFDVSSQDVAPNGVAFKPDGTKMYVMGLDSDTVYQYSLCQ